MAADRSAPLALGGILLVIGLAVLVSIDASDAFDRALIEAVRDPDLHASLGFMRALTELGSTGAMTVLAVLAAVVGLAIGPWRHGLIGAAVIGAASVGVEIVKAVMARARPDLLEPVIEEHGFSFPSGHATLSMVGYGILAVLITRSRLPVWLETLIVVGLGLLVVLIGISRVWLGVHFPTDVIAGWAAGWVIVVGYAAFTREVSREPAAGAADADPAAPRSDRSAAG